MILKGFQCNHGLLQNYNWVLVDFERAIMHRPDSFLRYILSELDLLHDDKSDWIEIILINPQLY